MQMVHRQSNAIDMDVATCRPTASIENRQNSSDDIVSGNSPKNRARSSHDTCEVLAPIFEQQPFRSTKLRGISS